MCNSINTSADSTEIRHRHSSGSVSPTSVVGETHAALLKDAPSKAEPNIKARTDKTVLEKLFSSKEEAHVMHVHKILGFSCLASYIYRFAHIGERDGNFGPQLGTLVFILHHWFLNASSFVFAIPQRRIRDGGFRIWPEYRFHSLVFASRALACMLLIWVEQVTKPSTPYYWMDLGIVLGTCAAADYGSHLQGEHKSPTVRGTTYTDPMGKWLASAMQFNLTACCLVGLRRYTMQLVAVCIIQMNSFLMTLRRKNVASHEVLTAAYGVLLVAGFWIAVVEDDYSDMMFPIGTYGSLAVILRMGMGLDKYVVWALLGVSLQVIRYYDLVEVINTEFWLCSYFVTQTVAIALGLRKRKLEMRPGQDSARMVYLSFVSYGLLFALILYNFFVVGWDQAAVLPSNRGRWN